MFSYVQTSNKLGIRAQSASLQWQEHFKWQSSGMLVFHMYKPQANLVQTSNLWGRTMPAGATGFLRKVQLISSFARGNSRFPPLPRIEVWLGFVHMKTQQIEGVVMAWLSPIECAAQTCFQSMPGVCTYENTAHRRCHQKSAHSSVKWSARRH